jgi:transposase InsO family protein
MRRDLLQPEEAQVVTEKWRKEYNTIRLPSSLNYNPSAPEVIKPA